MLPQAPSMVPQWLDCCSHPSLMPGESQWSGCRSYIQTYYEGKRQRNKSENLWEDRATAVIVPPTSLETAATYQSGNDDEWRAKATIR